MAIETSEKTSDLIRPFTTREAAARCGLTPRNLRRLERLGLVPSASGRSRVKGYRLSQPTTSPRFCPGSPR